MEKVIDSRDYEKNKAYYPWYMGSILRSYVDMYEATGNTAYLDKLIENANTIFANRDDKTGDKDNTGSARTCWAQESKHNYCQVVHSGMILQPITRFALLVHQNDSLKNKYQDIANQYVSETKKTLAIHDQRWKTEPVNNRAENIKSDEGFYFWAYNDPKSLLTGWNVPHNQQLVMGSTLLNMYKITGESDYKDKVRRMGRIFWRDLETNNGAYQWHYWWGDSLGGLSDKYEDIGHASIDIEYIDQIYSAGFNIGNSNNVYPTFGDMKQFAKTFTDKLFRGSYSTFHQRVNGETGNNPGAVKQISKYIDLAAYDPKVYSIAKRAFENAPTTADRNMLLGWAKLTKVAVELGK